MSTTPADIPDGAIAIVGMSARFPGAADIGEFWTNLRAGTCSITDFSDAELAADGTDPAEMDEPGFVPAKGYLVDADRVEAGLFGLTRRQAEVMDPQHRLLLENAWGALEDAGRDPRNVGLTTGVYVGCDESAHMVAALSDPDPAAEFGWDEVRALADKDSPGAWITRCLALTGPGVTVLTACSTALSAVHLAAQSLLTGECDLALAGGAAVDTIRRTGYRYQSGGVASPDGRCRPFDWDAAGTVRGNGAAVVALRRLRDALADGDPVHAVIRGSAMGNDGRDRIGFTAPSVGGQSAVMLEALAVADVSADSVQYIEMHGTATVLGDRVEAAAVTAAYGRPAHRIGIGSVKSNLGHLDAAAGVAGLIKAALMLRHRTIVPTVNVSRPHPELGLEAAGLDLVTALGDWPEPATGPRRAAVNSVGLGGGDVHVVLEEAPSRDLRTTDESGAGTPAVLPISARTVDQVRAAARALSDALSQSPDTTSIHDVARTLQHGRAALDVRAFVLAADLAEAVAALSALADGGPLVPAGPEPAERWARGEAVVWPKPATGPVPRVHLPGYRFAGERYGALA